MKSDTISPRRRILEEVLERRSRVVSALDPERVDPPAGSLRWPLAIAAMTGLRFPRALLSCRRLALDVMVVALAWLERIDDELDLPAERSPRREDDPVG